MCTERVTQKNHKSQCTSVPHIVCTDSFSEFNNIIYLYLQDGTSLEVSLAVCSSSLFLSIDDVKDSACIVSHAQN